MSNNMFCFQCEQTAGCSGCTGKMMIECLKGRVVKVPKGKPVFLEGDKARFVGVVLLGTVQVVQEDYYGNRSVMTVLQPGESFAEVFLVCFILFNDLVIISISCNIYSLYHFINYVF